MKKSRLLILLLVILLLLAGCNLPTNPSSKEDIFQYKNSKIGDNSAVLNILGILPSNEDFDTLTLTTDEEPYGMEIVYKTTEASITIETIKQTMLFNATYLFVLVRNAEWIIFDFDDHKYKFTREEVQEWYGTSLEDYTNEEDLLNLLREQLEGKSKLIQFIEN